MLENHPAFWRHSCSRIGKTDLPNRCRSNRHDQPVPNAGWVVRNAKRQRGIERASIKCFWTFQLRSWTDKSRFLFRNSLVQIQERYATCKQNRNSCCRALSNLASAIERAVCRRGRKPRFRILQTDSSFRKSYAESKPRLA